MGIVKIDDASTGAGADEHHLHGRAGRVRERADVVGRVRSRDLRHRG